jgi:hypothetical protein
MKCSDSILNFKQICLLICVNFLAGGPIYVDLWIYSMIFLGSKKLIITPFCKQKFFLSTSMTTNLQYIYRIPTVYWKVNTPSC